MFVEVLLCGVIGMAAVGEFFGYLIAITLWLSYLNTPLAAWIGGIGGLVFGFVWHLFIKKKRIKLALEAVKKQYPQV
jgi:hypothetical protein